MQSKLAQTESVADKSFDYIIVGGGTAGLTLAARLTEDPAISVAVLEAGSAHIDDPNILEIQGWTKQLTQPEYDWAYTTVPQPKAGGVAYSWSRGKGLGGSSAMNFMLWTRPQREDVDGIEALGNPGWNWDNLYDFFKKAEKFSPPTKHNEGDSYNADALGTKGSLTISFCKATSGAELPFRKSLETSGVTCNKDTMSGDIVGGWKSLSTIDPETYTRSYSVTGPLRSAIDRTNLQVLTDAHVTNIILSKETGGNVVAEGVQFEVAGNSYTAHATKEVVLCAGAVQTPQLLELSGVGNRAILEPLGIPVQIDLPGVGANVQEHIAHSGLAFLMQDSKNIFTSNMLLHDAFRESLLKSDADFAAAPALAFNGLNFLPLQSISDKADEIVAKAAARLAQGNFPPGLKAQYEHQLACLRDPRVPDVEIMVTPFALRPEVATQPIIALLPTLIHPWSRGEIHIASADPKTPPTIDPRYFEEELDLDILVEAWKFARRVARTGAFAAVTVAEVAPGPDVSSDEQIREYVRKNITTIWHTCGSASMLPRERGGVVDPQLKVYGARNVRVVDLAVVPVIISSHTQAMVYAVAERAADMISADARGE